MANDDGYLSRNRPHLNQQQRGRRVRLVRIDYMPGADALEILATKREGVRAGSVLATNSAILDAILTEWADLTGIKYREIDRPKTPVKGPELSDTYTRTRMSPDSERSARAQEFGVLTGITAGIAGVCTGAYDFVGAGGNSRQHNSLPIDSMGGGKRVACGAKRHRDGQPCQALSEPGKRRCRFHGGRSTGPTTPEGREKALANLRQFSRS